MENQNTRKCRFGALYTLLLLVLQAFIPLNVSAQAGCSVVVGGTDFVDKAHSDTLWAGNFNQLITKGPDGSTFGSGILAHADSAQQLTNNYEFSAYGVTTNTQIIDSTYNKVENALVLHVSSDAKGGDQLLFSYQVDGLKPGSDYEVSLTVTLLNGPDNELAKELEKAYKLGQAGINVYTNPNGYGNNGTKPAGMTDADLSFNKKYVIPVTIKGTLKDNEESVKLYLKTNYNFSPGLTLAVSDLTVKGCYAPKVISNQGMEVCQGEQVLFSLDKEYNAESYEWMMKEPGGSYTSVGTGKSIYKELKKDGTYSVYCVVNGVKAEAVEVKTKVCCVDEKGNAMSRLNVFNEDFGYFTDPHTYEDSKGNVTKTPATYAPERANVSWDLTTETKMKFDSNGQINDGYYGVVVPRPGGGYYQDISGNSMATWMNGVKSDHSSLETGKKGGAALFMNVTENYTGVIFSRKIEKLCADKEIFFETYIANMSDGTNPEVTINIKDAKTNKILESSKATAVKSKGWTRVNIDGLKVPASSPDVILEVLSTGGEGDLSGQFWKQGNDLIIDDIRFMVCSPPSVDIYSNDYSFAADTTICGDGKIKIGAQASEMLKTFFGGKPSYLYQTSTDGETWKNMTGITSEDVYTVNTKDYPGETNYFRVVVATADGLNQFLENPSLADYEDPCRAYSISKTFTVIRAGSIEMGEDEEKEGCGGEVIALNGSTDGTLVSFQWVDADGKTIATTKTLDYTVTEDETVLTFIGLNKEECSGRREFTIKKKPTVEFELEQTNECALTTVEAKGAPAGTKFVWTYDGNELEETGASFQFDNETYSPASLEVVGNATGYCTSAVDPIDVDIWEYAKLPETTNGDTVEFQVKKQDFSMESMVKHVSDLEWSLSADGPWNATAPKQPLAAADTFRHYVRTKDENCPSDPKLLVVIVNAAPKPGVRNDTVCVGTDIDFTQYITKTDEGFDLVWYETEEGVGAPSPKVEKARYGGRVIERWVTQKSKQAESEKALIQVLVAKVPDPVVEPNGPYCLGANSTELTATATADEANKIFATGVKWSLDGVELTDLNPSTEKEGEVTYKVIAYFNNPNALNGEKVCESKASDLKVKVIKTKEPTSQSDFKVNYLKTDGENGGFKDILAQSENKVAVAEPEHTLVWYDESKQKMTGTPKPTYSADMGDETFTYYVSQKMKGEPGCESELVKVTVTVSASPRPTTSSVAYCEGATPDALTSSVTINTLDGENENDYTLVWFETDPSSLSDEQKIATGLTTAPTAKTTVPAGKLFEVYTYYVAQMKTNEAGQKVISGVSELVDSVYARPKLSMVTPDPVCEPQTVDLTDKKYWDVQAAQVWVEALKDAELEDAKAIAETGTYKTEAYFYVRGQECRTSAPVNVTVTVDYIRGLAIEGVRTTCPNTSVELTAKTDSYSPSAITYTWTSSAETKQATENTFQTTELSKVTIYSLSAKAGACDVKALETHTIEIGDGPVVGNVNFSEVDLDNVSETASYDGVEFNSCGKEIALKADVTYTKDDFVWTLNGQKVGTGSTLRVTPTDGTSVYHVAYTNECPTGFDVTVNSVPVKATLASVSDMVICEGESFKASINVACPKDDYKVQWFKNGLDLGESSKTLEFTETTADLNGKYSFKVSYNDLCVSTGDVTKDDIDELKVRPFVKFDYNAQYVARRDSSLTIPLTFTVPSDHEPSNILWTEGGRSVNEGASYDDLKVRTDHKFTVDVKDEDFCSVPVNIDVLVDARLKLNVKGTSVICLNDDSEIVIDTAGTGNFVYPTKAGIKITQISPSVAERVYEAGWVADPADFGKLHFKIHPAEVGITTYKVDYFYRKDEGVDEQHVTKSYQVEVRQSPNIVPTRGLAMCANGEDELTVSLASIYPQTGVSLEWDYNQDIISSRTSQDITVRPTFDDDKPGNSYRLTYTVRATLDGAICDAVAADVDVIVYRPLEGKIEGPEVICAGLTADLDASSYDADFYTWTAKPQDASISDTTAAKIQVGPDESTEYNVFVTRGECSATSSFELEISQRPVIQSVDSIDYNIRDVQVVGGREPYTFWVDKRTGEGQNSNRLENVRYGRHTVYVVDDAKCDTKKGFTVLAPSIKIQPVVSPNGDGVYDAFFNNVLHDAFPNAKVTIYDRWGKKLVTLLGSDPGWDGTYNGTPMPSTDYWYEIEIKELNTIYTGHFTLMRQ